MVIIPIAIAFAAAGGFALCRMFQLNPHAREMLFAGAACFAASELAVVPMFLTRGASQAAVAQAGLVATIVHLFGCTAIGGGLVLAKSLQLATPFVYWLLAFYWISLIVLVVGLVTAVRSAPVSTASADH